MRTRLFARIARWCFCASGALALACAAAPAPVPEATSLVVDEAGALGDDEREAVLGRLKAIQDSRRAQIALLIARNTGGEPLADYALRVAERWKLGRSGRDDGLLILIVPSPAGARLEIGYGLEGAIPDARASRWLDELLPAIRDKQIADGVGHLLDRIDAALPAADTAKTNRDIFDEHPEWKMTFVLLVFSPFALFPMFAGRWGSIPGAFLLAAFLGGAAWSLWSSRDAAVAAAAIAFPLPLMWGLNWYDSRTLKPWLRAIKAVGNVFGVAMFFAVISVFVCGGLALADEPWWPGLFFSGLLAVGVAVFLFPGKPAEYLMVFLRSACLFVFILVLGYVALGPFTPDPSRLAFATAGLVTALASTALYFDSREETGYRWRGVRLSLAFYALALLAALPFALLSLFLAAGGEDAQAQLVQLATGGGSLAALIAIAVRVGLIAAARVGLGGLFGGGGAGRSD